MASQLFLNSRSTERRPAASARAVVSGAGRLDANRATGDREGKAALDRVEMGILREGQLQLMAERGACSGVEEGAGGGLLIRVLQLGTGARA